MIFNSKFKNIVVVLNPVAGGGVSKSECDESLKKILNPAASYHVVETTTDEAWALQLRDLCVNETLVISIGGDGTHSMVVRYLQTLDDQLEIECLFLPAGRGNDFIRGLSGFTKEGSEFFDWADQEALSWKKSKIDLGKMTDVDSKKSHLFLNMASLGYGGDVVEKVHQQKKIWSKTKAVYQIEGALTLFSTAVTDFKVFEDAKELYSGRFFGGFVGNGKCNGNGLYWTPESKINDQSLDFIFFPKPGILEMASSLNAVKKKKDPVFTYRRFVKPRIQLQFENAVSIELDGEFVGKFKRMEFECVSSRFLLWYLG